MSLGVRTLYLHIGDSKTGSSSIQSSLYASRAALAERHRLHYPPGRQLGTAPGAITSGNAEGLLASPGSFDHGLGAAASSGAVNGVVFSSEFMFVDLLAAPDLSFVPEVAGRHDFGRIEVLLFIRDPIAQAASVWQQSVKRGGSTGSIDEHAASFEAPCRVDRVLGRLEGLGGVGVSVLNYSAVGTRLLDEVAVWLGIDRATLLDPPIRINRSLSDAELIVQRAVNAEVGRQGRLLADALCEQVPDVEPARVAPSAAAQRELWERVRPCVERVNRRLPESQHYRFDQVEASPPDLRLSPAQLEVIGTTLGRTIDTGSPGRRDPAGPGAGAAVTRLDPARRGRIAVAARRLVGGARTRLRALRAAVARRC